jgi:hypothetical protein
MPVTTGEWLGSVYAGWTGTALWFLVGTDIEGYPIPPAGTAYALVVSALNYWMVTPEPDPEARGSVFGGMFGPPLKAGIVPIAWDGTTWRFIGTHEAPAHAFRIFNGVIPFYTSIEPLPYHLVHGSLFWTLYPPAVRTRSGTLIVAIPILNHPSGPAFPSAEDIQDVFLLTVPTQWTLYDNNFILENPYGFSLIGDGGWLYRSAYGTTYVAGTIYVYFRADPRSFLPPDWQSLRFVMLPFTRSQLQRYDGVVTEDGWILCFGELVLGSQALVVNKLYSGPFFLPYPTVPWPTQEQETQWIPVRVLCIGSFKPPDRLRLRVALLFPEVQWSEFIIEEEGCAIYERIPTPTGSRLVYRTGFARPIQTGYVPSISSPWLPILRSLIAEIHSKPRFVLYHHGFMQRILMAEVDSNTNDALYCSFRTVPHSGDDPAVYVHEVIMQKALEYEYRNGQPFNYRGTVIPGFADSRFFTEAIEASLLNLHQSPREWWDEFLKPGDKFYFYPNLPERQFPTFVGHSLPDRYMMTADALDSYFYEEVARTWMRTIITASVVRAPNGETYLDPINVGYWTDSDPWALQLYFVGTMTLEGQTHLIEPWSVWYELYHRLRVSGYSGRHSELFECSLRIDTLLGPEFLRTEIPQPAFGKGGPNPSAFELVIGIGHYYYQNLPRIEGWYSDHPYTLSEYFPETFPSSRSVPSDKAIRVIFGKLMYRQLGYPYDPRSDPFIYFPYGLVYSKGETYRFITNPIVGYLLWRRVRTYFDPFPSSRAVEIAFGPESSGRNDAGWLFAEEDVFTPYRVGWHSGHAAPAPIATFGQACSFHPIVEFRGTCPIPLVFAPPFRELFARAGTVLVMNSESVWKPVAVFAGVAKDRSELSPMYWLVGAWRYRGSQFFHTHFLPDGVMSLPVAFVPIGSGYVVGTSMDGGWWQMPLAGTVYHPLFARAFVGNANRLLFFHQGWQQTLPAGRQKRLPDPFEAFLRTGTYNGLDYEVTGVRQIITMGHAKVQLLPRHAIWAGIRTVPYFRIDGGECPLWQGEPILAVDGFPLDDGRVHVWVYAVYGVYSLIVTPDGVEDWSFDPLPRFLRSFVGSE